MSEEIEVHDAIGALRGEWTELADRVSASPFLRPSWIAAWWEGFGSGRLTVLGLRRDGELAGVLPLATRGRTMLSPTNWHTPLYGPLAADDDARLKLFEAALARGPRRLDLSFLESRVAESLESVAGERRTLRRRVQSSPYVEVDCGWDEYWRSRSQNLRKTVRRCRNRLAERGEVSIEILTGGDGLEERLQEGMELEASGWKGERGTAIASTPESRRFYRQICRQTAEEGTLCMGFLRIDGAAVAFCLDLETAASHYSLKLGHDAALNAIGPGTVLTAAMVERTFERGLDTYEFLGAADRHKMRWAEKCRDKYRVQVFAATPGGWLDHLAWAKGRPLAKRALRRSASG